MREMQRLADQLDGGSSGYVKPSGSGFYKPPPSNETEMDRMRRLADEAENAPDVHAIRAEMRGTAVREDPYAYVQPLWDYPESYPQLDYLEDGGQAPVLLTRGKKVRTIHGYMPLPAPMRLAR